MRTEHEVSPQQEARFHSALGGLATWRRLRQVKPSQRYCTSESTALAPCFHSTNGTACSTDESPRNRALRRPRSSDGSRPKVTARTTVTHQPTRRRVAKPTREPKSNNRPNTTASSLPRDHRNGCGGVSTTTDSPFARHRSMARSAHSSQPSFATYQRRCRHRLRSPLHPSSTPKGERKARAASLSRQPRCEDEETCEWHWRTYLVGASRRTDRRIPNKSSDIAGSGHATSWRLRRKRCSYLL
jgi:hypothetical protein